MTETVEQASPAAHGKESAAHSKEADRTTTRVLPIALLTGGGDKPYALGLAGALLAHGLSLDFIGSDEVDGPQLHQNPRVNFLNLRGDQSRNASRLKKLTRVGRYYVRLVAYAATARAKVFHLLWNNKFEFFDRTALMLYYRLLGKQLVFTAHNVNAGKRDGNDTWMNRFSLRVQYALSHHIFVHTEQMKRELGTDFSVPPGKVSVIPFGINNTIPETALNQEEARKALGLEGSHKVMLCFGNIAPYKGLEYAVEALAEASKKDSSYRLVIAGTVKGCDDYWAKIQGLIASKGMQSQIVQKIGYIPDERVEVFFKAADVLLLPYTHIFQSGVLFLSFNFGLPVIAADVGALRDEIDEGKTGWICAPRNPRSLAQAIGRYFSSDLHSNLNSHRHTIRAYARERFSWTRVAEITDRVYRELKAK